MNSTPFIDWTRADEPRPEAAAITSKTSAQPDALHDELQQDMRLKMQMYGVTNREVSADGKSLTDGRWKSAVGTTTQYFREDVTVSGKPGSFNAVASTDPEVISKQEFDRGVAAQVKAADGKLGIFIHGIRTASGEAGLSAAELSAETGEPFVIEDWASTKSVNVIAAHQEKADDRTSFLSQPMIDASVEDLASKFGAENIDMVAHSRGSMNQIRALADLQNKDMGTVNSATFAHSDVDVSDFETSLSSFQDAAKHVNVLYNPQDNALRLSELQRFGQVARVTDSNNGAIEQSARLGRVGLSPGDGGKADSYVASAVPNYFSIARDSNNDNLGHAFAPSLVASMIASPANYQSFSTLKMPSALKQDDCPLSPISGVGKVFSAIPYFPLRVLSTARAQTDIVSDSPEVQKHIASNSEASFAMFNSETATL